MGISLSCVPDTGGDQGSLITRLSDILICAAMSCNIIEIPEFGLFDIKSNLLITLTHMQALDVSDFSCQA